MGQCRFINESLMTENSLVSCRCFAAPLVVLFACDLIGTSWNLSIAKIQHETIPRNNFISWRYWQWLENNWWNNIKGTNLCGAVVSWWLLHCHKSEMSPNSSMVSHGWNNSVGTDWINYKNKLRYFSVVCFVVEKAHFPSLNMFHLSEVQFLPCVLWEQCKNWYISVWYSQ